MADPSKRNDVKGKALISYFRGEAFRLFYKQFTENGKLTKEGKNCEVVKQALDEKYCEKGDRQVTFEKTISLQLGRRDEIPTFLEAVKVTYEEVALTEEQKFAFLPKTFLADVMISNFVILHSSQTFEELINTLKADEQSKARFPGGTSNSTTEGTQDVRMPPVQVIRINEGEAQGKDTK